MHGWMCFAPGWTGSLCSRRVVIDPNAEPVVSLGRVGIAAVSNATENATFKAAFSESLAEYMGLDASWVHVSRVTFVDCAAVNSCPAEDDASRRRLSSVVYVNVVDFEVTVDEAYADNVNDALANLLYGEATVLLVCSLSLPLSGVP